jgi:hypothetical protein
MRFEQLLEKTKRLADPSWVDQWLDYKVRQSPRLLPDAFVCVWGTTLLRGSLLSCLQGLKDIIGAEETGVLPADAHPTARDAVVATLCEFLLLLNNAITPQPCLPVGFVAGVCEKARLKMHSCAAVSRLLVVGAIWRAA